MALKLQMLSYILLWRRSGRLLKQYRRFLVEKNLINLVKLEKILIHAVEKKGTTAIAQL